MKRKIWKGSLYVLVFLAVIIGVALFFSLNRVDKTPYFETEYYSTTITDLNKALSESKETKGNFSAGFGKANITPSITSGIEDPANGVFNSVPLAGFSASSSESATGAHDSIFVKAVAIEVNNKLVVMVGTDILLTPPEVADNVANMLKPAGLTREQIYFGATHTHSSVGSWSPGLVGEESAGKYQPALISWLSIKVKDAILAAISDIQLAKVGSSSLHAPDFIRNRMVDNGRLNDQLDFISIEQINGRKAIIGSFSAHATVIGSSNQEFSGDYPGYFQRKLEEETVDLALFFAGSVGSHTNAGKGSGFEKARIIGESLADSIIQNLSKIELSAEATFSNIASTIQIPKLQLIRISENIRLSKKVGEMLLPKIETTYIQAIKLNNLLWITQPCELSGECALDLKNALETAGYNSIITSFNGQYLGYVVPNKYYYFDTYETSLMSWYGPSMADYIMELNYTICDSLTQIKM